MFYFIDAGGYIIGVCIGLFALAGFCVYMAVKTSKRQNAMREAIAKFEAMAKGKTYDDIVAIMKKPQEEVDKVCPNTGDNIKVTKWVGGYYYWEQCRYDIVAVFNEDGTFDNVKMYE